MRAPLRHNNRIAPEAVALFWKLENQRPKDRSREDKRELARLLDLEREYWAMQSVLDRSRKPCHPPHCGAYTDWHTCRHVRLLLLEAANA